MRNRSSLVGLHAICPGACAPVLLVALLAGCGGSTAKAPPVGTYAMLHPTIVPNEHGSNPDSFYLPNPIRVRVGQTVMFTNMDADLHDVTSDTGLFASGPIGYKGTWRWTAARPGTYTYFCTVHPEMHGEIIVSS